MAKNEIAKGSSAELGSPRKVEHKDDFLVVALSEFKDMAKWGKPTNERELITRINKYFDRCAARELRPAPSSLALALSTNTSMLYKWKNEINCTPEWSEIIQRALQVVFSTTESLLLHRKLDPVAGIWLTKNWLGYKDDVSLDEVATAKKSRASALKTIDQMHQEMVVATYEVVDGKTVEAEGD